MEAGLRYKDEQCSALAFYDVRADAQTFRNVFFEMVDWFESLGHSPHKISVRAEGFSGKMVGFDRTHSRLKQASFETVNGIELCSLVPEGNSALGDWNLSFALQLRDLPRQDSYCLVNAWSSIAELSEAGLLPVANHLIQQLSPRYGFGFRRLRNWSSNFYSVGVNHALDNTQQSDEERLRISQWGHTGRRNAVWHEGIVRDLYPWNFLTAPHLPRDIDGTTLQAWIQEDSARGELTQLTNGVWLWSLTDEQITQLHPVLDAQGVIFHAENYWDEE